MGDESKIRDARHHTLYSDAGLYGRMVAVLVEP